jgi:tRNA 2-thiouridine synthesizing protein A
VVGTDAQMRLEADSGRRPGSHSGPARDHHSRSDHTLVTTPHHTLDAPGMACIDLTPLIAQTMRQLGPGDVLAVHADDPAARVGVPAWCRLTNNPLVHTSPSEDSSTATTFHITKKAN